MQLATFTTAKQDFDNLYKNKESLNIFVPEHLTLNKTVNLLKKDKSKNEQYYKWQFIYSIINSGLVAKDYIGTEINFPKGNKSSAALKLDAAVFDNNLWFAKYKDFHENNNSESLDWLRKHLCAVIEIKKEDSKNIQEVWEKQLKSYLKESERKFCLGVLYDTERLYLFKKENDKFIRFNDEYNIKGKESSSKEMSLHLPDSYRNIPNLEHILNWKNNDDIDRSRRNINQLDVISGIQSIQISNAMSSILRTMDKVGMKNQKGFEILIQVMALKIFDEKQNEKTPASFLRFYIQDSEKNYSDIPDKKLQTFIKRITELKEDASGVYYRILGDNSLNVKDLNHIKLLIEVVAQFQDFSFVRSQKTDLYQLVFYKFAGQFSKDSNSQFVTPLPMIDFLVSMVNPRQSETVIDPTVGIADFLSVSYVNSKSKLDDNNIYGMDIDDQMVMLATLNMLLNGDGNSTIRAQHGYGSILTKFDNTGGVLDLIPPEITKDESIKIDWDERPDNKKLKKFDVVLTNPPFGEDRAFFPKDQKDNEVISCYELWHLYNQNKIDLGVVFLENAYRILKENGRMGIVLSNSIASIESHKIARKWLMERMRIVAIFDMPANVFAETGVNTTIIVAYKPSKDELAALKEHNYQIFIRNINKVGYEVKTSKRVKFFETKYKINYETFETEIDEEGNPIIDEDFTQTVKDFRKWCTSQEKTLQDLFIKEK